VATVVCVGVAAGHAPAAQAAAWARHQVIVGYRARLLAAVSAQGGAHDLHRAVGLASHNPEANKLIAARGGPTLVAAEGRVADTAPSEVSR